LYDKYFIAETIHKKRRLLDVETTASAKARPGKHTEDADSSMRKPVQEAYANIPGPAPRLGCRKDTNSGDISVTISVSGRAIDEARASSQEKYLKITSDRIEHRQENQKKYLGNQDADTWPSSTSSDISGSRSRSCSMCSTQEGRRANRGRRPTAKTARFRISARPESEPPVTGISPERNELRARVAALSFRANDEVLYVQFWLQHGEAGI
jgi:hypothetical protein